MIVRERYMRLIRDFMDKPVIKIITGMRRSGKSALLELTRQELLDRGVDRKNIIFINFESLRYEALRTIRRCTQRSSKSLDRQKDGSTSFSMKSKK